MAKKRGHENEVIEAIQCSMTYAIKKTNAFAMISLYANSEQNAL